MERQGELRAAENLTAPSEEAARAVVVTGATSGIGLEVMRLLAREGHLVFGVGRSAEHCARAREDILASDPGARIEFFAADLMQQDEVLRVAGEMTRRLHETCGGALHALVNNAGCVRGWYMTTAEGYEQQFALNHLAGFLLTHALLPCLSKAGGRVVMTGSQSHRGVRVRWNDVMLRRGYNPLTAYKQSKLCNLLFANGLNDRLAASGVRAYVVDPGLVNTDIGNKNAGGLVGLVWTLRKRRGAAPCVPAKTYAFLCGQTPAPEGLYYHLCERRSCGTQVTRENAEKLFALSERLCGVKY